MRVCMLLDDTYPPDIRVRKEAMSLAADDHDVTLLCQRGEEPAARERVDDLDVVRIRVYDRYGKLRSPANAPEYVARLVNRPWARAIADHYGEEPFDVLHVHDLPLVRTALDWRGDRDVAVVADLHENWPEAVRQYRRMNSIRDLPDVGDLIDRVVEPVWRLKRLERFCVRGADRTIAVVPEGKAHYVRSCGALSGDVAVVPNYVDRDALDREGVEARTFDGEFVLLYVGVVGGKHRGLDTVVRALPEIRAAVPDARFVVVGDGPYRESLERVARDVGVADAVEFTGWVAFEDLPAYVAGGDVGVVPYRDNPHTATTIPHKLTQYMAFGLPVLVSDVAPLERVIEETAGGAVFPAGDPRGFATAAIELASNPEETRRLGANAGHAVSTTYNWETAGDALEATYEDLEAEFGFEPSDAQESADAAGGRRSVSDDGGGCGEHRDDGEGRDENQDDGHRDDEDGDDPLRTQ